MLLSYMLSLSKILLYFFTSTLKSLLEALTENHIYDLISTPVNLSITVLHPENKNIQWKSCLIVSRPWSDRYRLWRSFVIDFSTIGISISHVDYYSGLCCFFISVLSSWFVSGGHQPPWCNYISLEGWLDSLNNNYN